jgi:cell division septation protein DedD
MSPFLIDQRRLLIIIIAILGALVMIFYSGYIAGIRHADANRTQTEERTELPLPAAAPEPVRSEAVKPAVVAPGANIDVDVPDAKPSTAKPKLTVHKPSVQVKAAVTSTPSPAQTVVVKPKPVVTDKPAVKQEAATEQNGETTASASEPEPKPAATEDSAGQIVDDASSDDARYSIQIGIYGSQHNASKQVDSLIEQHLSGYYQAYQNQKEEARYRVRFGYFASYKSASRALEIWNKAHPDSRSYIVRLLR